jgi:hypothetical protein
VKKSGCEIIHGVYLNSHVPRPIAPLIIALAEPMQPAGTFSADALV